MPTAEAVAIAEAVKTALAGGTFSQSFTPERVYRPIKDLTELVSDGLKVLVIPAGLDTDGGGVDDAIAHRIAKRQGSRGRDRKDQHITTLVQQAVDPDDIATIDGLILLVEQIDTFLNRKRMNERSWVKTTTMQFNPDWLREYRAFQGAVTTTYRFFL